MTVENKPPLQPLIQISITYKPKHSQHLINKTNKQLLPRNGKISLQYRYVQCDDKFPTTRASYAGQG